MTSLLTKEEIWKRVPSSELLWASNHGRVSSDTYATPMPNGGFKLNKLMPTKGVLQKCSGNYSRLIIVFRRKTYKVASLVAEAFLGARPKGKVVSHSDEDSINNRPNNLEYITQKENLNKPKVKEYHRRVCRAKMTS